MSVPRDIRRAFRRQRNRELVLTAIRELSGTENIEADAAIERMRIPKQTPDQEMDAQNGYVDGLIDTGQHIRCTEGGDWRREALRAR